MQAACRGAAARRAGRARSGAKSTHKIKTQETKLVTNFLMVPSFIFKSELLQVELTSEASANKLSKGSVVSLLPPREQVRNKRGQELFLDIWCLSPFSFLEVPGTNLFSGQVIHCCLTHRL